MARQLTQRSHSRRRGMSMLYTLVAMGVLLGFASVGVDLARVQVAKTELRTGVDAAVRAGAGALSDGSTAARDAAIALAAMQTVDGTPLALQSADIELGVWDLQARTFSPTANASSANAVRITGRRVASRGTAIPLVFAGLLGVSTCDVTAEAIAYCEPGTKLQLVGTGSVTVMNNFYGGTYRSSTTVAPNPGTALDGATVASNGSITAGMNENLKTAILGPSGTSNLTTTDETVNLPSNLSFPLSSTSLASYGDINVGGGTHYVPGGTYHVDDLTIGNHSTLAFTGPATLYISGNVKFNGDVTIQAYNSVPGNLKIYHTGTGSFGSNSANNTTIIADMYAPGVDLAVKNNATLYGRFIVKSLYAKNNLTFFYDDDLAPPTYAPGSGGAVSLVK